MNKINRDIQNIMGLVVISGVIGLSVLLFYKEPPANNATLINVLLAILAGMAVKVTTTYFPDNKKRDEDPPAV